MGALDTLTTVTVPSREIAWWNGVTSRAAETHTPCPSCGAPLELTYFIRGLFHQYGKNFLCPLCPQN